MEKIDKAIEILQALKEGKTVEWCSYILHSGEWTDWHEFEFDGKNIDLINSQYRIKKEPAYRPYANAEEFLKASKEHGIYVKGSTNVYYNVNIVYDYGVKLNIIGENSYSWMQLYTDLTWADGTPCGILEQF